MQEYNQTEDAEIENQHQPEEAAMLNPIKSFSPNNPPWNSLMAFLLWFTSLGLILVLPALLVFPYLKYRGIETNGNPDLESAFLNDPTAVAIGLGATGLAHIITLIFAWLIVTRYREFSFTEMLGWRWGGFKYWHGLIILASVFVVALVLANVLGSPENEMTKILKSSRTAVFIVAILATFSAPIVEEVVYRGVLYSAFQRTFNSSVAVIFVTFIFTAVHVAQYQPDYGAIISLCYLSFLITLVRAKTGNLLPCIAIHLVFNGFQSILLITDTYINAPETLSPDQPASLVVSLLTFVFNFLF